VIVVDTNLLVYLFVRGSRTAEAEAVLGRDNLWAAPWLWRSEFRNSLIGLVRRGDVHLEEALRMTEEAERWMEGREYVAASAQVLELAEGSGCSAYDCEFAAVAQDLEISLVTVDGQLLKAFPLLAIHPRAFVARQS
jgi:predicted nucleic acid-binding protein